MPQVNVMYWNLGTFNQARWAQCGASYISMIAQVMQRNNIGLAGFSGIFIGLGRRFGQQLVSELNYTGRQANQAWNEQASPPLGQGRGEQYLFAWNTRAVSAYQPPGLNFWLWQYPVPGQQGQYFGFPRPENSSPDMPPYTMFFQLGTSGRWMPMAILAAPAWNLGNPLGNGILTALASVSRLAPLDLGNGSLLMGSFNVPRDDSVATNGSNGAYAFGGLAGPQGKYDQGLRNASTVLAARAAVAMTEADAMIQTSDNFFLRRNSAQGGITGNGIQVQQLITSSLPSINNNGVWQPAPFRPGVTGIESDYVGARNVTAGAQDSYESLDDAFAVYRQYVSDHLPINLTLNF